MRTVHDAKVDGFVEAVNEWMEAPTFYSLDEAVAHVRHLIDGLDSAQLDEGERKARAELGPQD